MKGLRYHPTSDEQGHFLPWLNDLRNRSGAYVIRSQRARQCLYVGESHTGNLAKTIKRHFYPWRDDEVRQHHTYNRSRVEVAVRLTPPGSAVGAQNNLIGRLNPRDNGNGWGEQPF